MTTQQINPADCRGGVLGKLKVRNTMSTAEYCVVLKSKRNSIIYMDVVCSKVTDFNAWVLLSREVEPLFGPMVDEIDFQEALRKDISLNSAFCIYYQGWRIKSRRDTDSNNAIRSVKINLSTTGALRTTEGPCLH